MERSRNPNSDVWESPAISVLRLAVGGCQLKLIGIDGRTHRLQLRQIADVQTLYSPLTLIPKPIGSTIILRNGTEIDVALSLAELKSHIIGW
jgi:hypothetical protein